MNILDTETRARIDAMAQDLHDARARVAELERENERWRSKFGETIARAESAERELARLRDAGPHK